MKTVSLAYALKLKSRLMKKINLTRQKYDAIRNVYERGTVVSVDDKYAVLVEYFNLCEKYKGLVKVIATANAENNIPQLVAVLDFARNDYKMIDSLDVNDAPHYERNPVTGERVVLEQVMQISKERKLNMLTELDAQINKTQDLIDNINGSVTVELEDNLFI